jgi:hypothetical protein
LVLAGAPLGAQAPAIVGGRVVQVLGADTLPASGALVSLHRIGRTAQGIVDSVRTADRGRFRFRVRPDSTAVFLVSARHAGIEYFSDPVRPGSDTSLMLIVSDTSSVALVELSARHVIVGRPEADGRPVLDLVTLANRSGATRVAVDTLSPSWSLVLPAGARNLEVEQGDVSPTAVEQRGDSVLMFAPIPPGRMHLMIGYRLPAEGREFSWLVPADTFDLLLEEEGASVRGGDLVAAGPVDLSGKLLQRWTTSAPAPGIVVVRFGSPGRSGTKLLTALVATTALTFAALLLVLIRRARTGTRAGVTAGANPVEELVRLDAEYAGREANVPGPEWSDYLRRRAALKTAAEAALATRHRRS